MAMAPALLLAAIIPAAGGVGHAMWTDIRTDSFDPPCNADQDPFTATLTASR